MAKENRVLKSANAVLLRYMERCQPWYRAEVVCVDIEFDDLTVTSIKSIPTKGKLGYTSWIGPSNNEPDAYLVWFGTNSSSKLRKVIDLNQYVRARYTSLAEALNAITRYVNTGELPEAVLPHGYLE